MNKKKKIIIIVIIIILALSACTCACLGIAAYALNSVYRQAEEIKESTIKDVCESHGDFSQTEYKAWFSSSYRDTESFEDAKKIVEDAFPSDFECANLAKKNIFEFYSNNHSINTSIINGESRATLSFPKSENQYITIVLEKVSNEWEIESISVTNYSG